MAFQEIDYKLMYGSIAKWTAEIADPQRVDEVMLRALRVATTGTPGPVVIAVPEDVLTAPTTARAVAPQPAIDAAPSVEAVEKLRAWLGEAKRPVAIAGHALDVPGGREALLRFVEAWDVPVLVAFRRHDLMPNAHRLFAGNMGLANPADQMAALREADLLLALGTRLGDITTQGYAYPRLVRPEMRLVHVHDDAGVLGTHFAADLAIACPPASLLAALGQPSTKHRGDAGWASRLTAIRDRIAGRSWPRRRTASRSRRWSKRRRGACRPTRS